jgi:biotin carboxyl carrier protein
MLEQNPHLLSGPPLAGRSTQFLDQQSKRIIGGSPVSDQGATRLPELTFDERCEVVECPMDSVVLEVMVSENDEVIKGDVICVVTAMKMEPNVTSPVSGKIFALQQIRAGDSIGAGSVVAAVLPDAGGSVKGSETAAGAWSEVLEEVSILKQIGLDRLGPDSNEPGVVRQRNRGKLTCRQRIDLFLDDDSFREVGSIAVFPSYDDEGGFFSSLGSCVHSVDASQFWCCRKQLCYAAVSSFDEGFVASCGRWYRGCIQKAASGCRGLHCIAS